MTDQQLQPDSVSREQRVWSLEPKVCTSSSPSRRRKVVRIQYELDWVLQPSWRSAHVHRGPVASASFGSVRQISPLCFTDSGFNSDSSPDIRRSAPLRNRLVRFNLTRPAWVVARTRVVRLRPRSFHFILRCLFRSVLVAAVRCYTGSYTWCVACAVGRSCCVWRRRALHFLTGLLFITKRGESGIWSGRSSAETRRICPCA
ncbi:hypothetical protein SRHO_G00095570 [Serrasalmus rhombeus]